MDEIPYFDKTHRDYEISGPDKDGEIELEWNNENNRIWLNKEDIMKLLKRFGDVNFN